MSESKPIYKRVLLKLSGEALMGSQDSGIDPDILNRVAAEIKQISELGVEVGVVIGAGNIFRGKGLADAGMDRITGDHMGMLATVMNCLALQDAIERSGPSFRVRSALSYHQVCEDYVRRRAVRHLEKGRVVIFGAGTGNPYFTTDTAAVLRAIEVNADAILKGTRVDGIYNSDPEKDKGAIKFDKITFKEVMTQGLKVMDMTAFTLSEENKLPIIVFYMNTKGNLLKLVSGEKIGTIVDN